MLEHSPGELAKKKLSLLMPFYILKLRKQVVAATTSKKRRALSGELAATFKQIVETLDDAERSALLTKEDRQVILGQLEILFAVGFNTPQLAAVKLWQRLEFMVVNPTRTKNFLYKKKYPLLCCGDFLYSQIYEPYKEFEEVRKMKDDIILSTGEKMVMKAELDKSLKIAKNMLNTGISPEKAAKIAELPLAKVKALLKTTAKTKLTAR